MVNASDALTDVHMGTWPGLFDTDVKTRRAGRRRHFKRRLAHHRICCDGYEWSKTESLRPAEGNTSGFGTCSLTRQSVSAMSGYSFDIRKYRVSIEYRIVELFCRGVHL